MPITEETILLVAKANPNGISIDLTTGQVLTGVGFCAAYRATQNNIGLEGLEESMEHALGPCGSGIIGTWSHAGSVYFDSVKRYTTRTAAVGAAQRERQLAIYNLKTRKAEDIMAADGSFNPGLVAARKRSHNF